LFMDKQQGDAIDNKSTDKFNQIFAFTIHCLQEFIFAFNIEGSVAYQLFDSNDIFSLISQHYEELSIKEYPEVLDWIKTQILAKDENLDLYLS